MTTFQLDQNVNSEKLANKCNADGFAKVWRFRREWAQYPGGFKDHQLLPVVMAGSMPLITNDREMARDHTQFIPPRNPGLIIVGFAKGTIKPFRRADMERLLDGFKGKFEAWHSVTWANSIVEITQRGVEIWHVSDGRLIKDGYFEFDEEPEWPRKLQEALDKNGSRYLLPPPAEGCDSN